MRAHALLCLAWALGAGGSRRGEARGPPPPWWRSIRPRVPPLPRGLSADLAFQLQRELALRGAGVARRSAEASAEAARRLRTSGSAEAAFTDQLRRAVSRRGATALNAALRTARLDEPLEWESPAGRAALSAAGAVLQPQVRKAARSLRVLVSPGLVDSEAVSRLGVRVALNISDVVITGLDSMLQAPELAPDGGPHFRVTTGLGRLRASARVSAELRLSLLGGRLSYPLLRSRFQVVAHLSKVRLTTRWRCAVSASALLSAPLPDAPSASGQPALPPAAPPEAPPPPAEALHLPAFSTMLPTIDCVDAAVGNVVVELRRARSGLPFGTAARAQPPLPGTTAGWVGWALGRGGQPSEQGRALPGAHARARYGWPRPPDGISAGAPAAAARPGAPPPVTSIEQAPGYVWRLLSYAVGRRLAVVIAREVEGATLSRLRQLT